jgi:integrase
VRVAAGVDRLTGKRVELVRTAPTLAAAERLRTRLLAEVDGNRAARTQATLGYALDEWLATSEIEASTRDGYVGYIERTIRPALGSLPLGRINPDALERFYAELRRCRQRCDRRPFIHHVTDGPHECGLKCRPHACRPLAASSIRQIHAIISAALSAAVRWGWIASNPAQAARRPRQPTPTPDPPTPEEAGRIVKAAFAEDESWGTLVWLVMVTGIRGGELAALRWDRVDLHGGVIEVRQSYLQRGGEAVEKDTKTHQMRRIALDDATVALLRDHQERSSARLAPLGVQLEGRHFVFSYSPDLSRPCNPDGLTHRYGRTCQKAGVNSHLHALRHYSATELLTAGIDLRTIAGRLGHGGGGATTLRVYAAWNQASDRRAAAILGSRMAQQQPG